MTNSLHPIILDENGGAVVIRSGIKVVFNVRGGIDVYGNVPVTLHAPDNDIIPSYAKAAPHVAGMMDDGTIYAGISPDTGKPMYTTPADAPPMDWSQAKDYAASLEAHGHKDWRLPSKAELNVLFNSRAAIGGFEEDWYWSSTKYSTSKYAWAHRFINYGGQSIGEMDESFLVRCIRR